jgi:hypothetical protein
LGALGSAGMSILVGAPLPQLATMIDFPLVAGVGTVRAMIPSNAEQRLLRQLCIIGPVFIDQDAQRGTVKVIKLTVLQRPEKGTQAQ